MILFFLLPLILLTIAAVNFVQIRTPNRSSELAGAVGVLVPMRNEAENVEGLVATLAAQEGLLHFYLLDDSSEDQTLELLQRFTKADSRFTVIKGAALKDKWIGKTWALQQLYEVSKEDVLVSIDADVRLSNDAINKAVTLMHGARLDFVSPYPRQIARTLGERLIQPLLQWSWLTTVPLRYAESSGQKSMAVANGQFFVVRRSALDSIGGYATVKHAVIDDVFLARELVKSGSSGTVINGSDIAETRMYTSWSQIEAGYGKSLSKAFGSILGALFVVVFLFATSIAPLVLGLLGNPYGWLGFGAIVGTRVLSAIKSRGNVLDSVLHPISVVALIYLIAYSYLMRGSIQWKGRTV
ncbi:MAG: glycosyltransferase [Candidatus Planktophila sp.]|nr:glycosyltransferase [Candidatus Planktophila sp.]